MARDAIVQVTWVMDPKALNEIATDKEMGQDMVKRARAAIPTFISLAPERTRRYKKGIRVKRRIERISGFRRQVARLESTAYSIQDGKKRRYGWAVEWAGRKNDGPHRTLGKTAAKMRRLG